MKNSLVIILCMLSFNLFSQESNSIEKDDHKTEQILDFLNKKGNKLKAKAISRPLKKELLIQLKELYKKKKYSNAIIAKPLKKELLIQLKEYHKLN